LELGVGRRCLLPHEFGEKAAACCEPSLSVAAREVSSNCPRLFALTIWETIVPSLRLVKAVAWNRPESSQTLALASLVKKASSCVKLANLLAGSCTSVSIVPELTMPALSTEADPPLGLPGSVDPPSVESSTRFPCALMLLGDARFKRLC
jgi:hypothetical protein